MAISKENTEQLRAFSTLNRDPRGWVVIVNYLVSTGEGSLIAGDDVKGVCWFTLERHSNKIHLSSGEAATSFGLAVEKPSGRDTLAFNHNQIISKAFNRVVNKMERKPQVLQVLSRDFTTAKARKVFAKFLGTDYKTIDHSNFKKVMFQYFDEIDEHPVGVGRPSKIYQFEPGHHE